MPKISELTAGTAPTGAEKVPAVQGGVTVRLTTQQIAALACLPNYLTGLTLSTAGSSATFGIASGAAADSTNVLTIALASAYTKTTSAWAVGTGNGALDTGAIANSTWYHVYLIARSDTGVVDVLFSTSVSSPTMPTNYDRKRRIGSMKTNGSAQWTKFTQSGDEFLWDISVNDVNNTTQSTTAVMYALSVATGVNVVAKFAVNFYQTSTSSAAYISSPDTSDEAPAGLGGTGPDNMGSGNYATVAGGIVSFQIRTNTSAQIRVRMNSGTAGNFAIRTYGWIDRRGRDG